MTDVDSCHFGNSLYFSLKLPPFLWAEKKRNLQRLQSFICWVDTYNVLLTLPCCSQIVCKTQSCYTGDDVIIRALGTQTDEMRSGDDA